jgi:hypothetical protein
MKTKPDEQYSPEETARRRDDAIRRALNTPPTPHKEMVSKTAAKSRRKRPAKSAPKGR